jgi:hypothetical protein
MPCGGIYYFGGDTYGGVDDPDTQGRCLHCGKTDIFGFDHLDHFCMEWDGHLHSACVVEFLNGDMGETVINHHHTLELGPNVNFIKIDMVAIESVDQPQIAAHATATEKS